MDKNLKRNGTELYLTHNFGKSMISERFSRTLKSNINKIHGSYNKECIYWSTSRNKYKIKQYVPLSN